MKLFFTAILVLILGACKPIYKETWTTLFYSDISIENITAEQRSMILSKLSSWAGKNGFQLLPHGATIDQAISSGKDSDYYLEVYSRPLNSSRPKSMFYITVRDINGFFRASLVTLIDGTSSDHDRQMPIMDTMNKSFQTEFSHLSPFSWGSYLK